MNAVRHGLRSATVVIPGLELQSDWDQFLQDAVASLDPVGAIEYALAERAATLIWRLRRAARAERDAAILVARRRGLDGDPELGPAAALLAMAEQLIPERVPETLDRPPAPPQAPPILPPADVLQTLSRYEARLSRQLNQSLHELQALQDRRQGRDAPLLRVDVEGLPHGG